jgi:hypothetical protein
MRKISILFLIVLISVSCHERNHHKGGDDSDLLAVPPVVKADGYKKEKAESNARVVQYDIALSALSSKPVSSSNSIDTTKKITKEGNIRFATADVVKARKDIINAVQHAGGYIAEDNESKDEGSGSKEYVLKVRIPAKNFDFLVDTISSNADKIDSKNINIKDVTTEYIDTKTQVANKKRLEQTYLGLLNKAARMSDVLQIEEKITEIQSDIESTEGQLNYLVKQVAYSSLDITFYNRGTLAESDNRFGYKFRIALIGGWDVLQELFFSLISVWPILLIAAAGYAVFAKWRNRKQAKNT